MRYLTRCAAAILMVCAGAMPSHGEVIYTNTFETAVGPGWSDLTGRALGINATPSGRNFLGWAGTTGPLNGVSHEQLMLTTPVPAAGLYQVDFDLYLINSWDGNNTTF